MTEAALPEISHELMLHGRTVAGLAVALGVHAGVLHDTSPASYGERLAEVGEALGKVSARVIAMGERLGQTDER